MYLIEPIRNGKWVYDQGTAMAIQAYIRDEVFLGEDIIFPYLVNPSIQLGVNQNAYEEVNQPFMDENDIGLVRRDTGGGAIYLDDRNMSYCYLISTDNANDVYGNFKKLYDPIIRVLKNMGVEGLEQKGRNDLTLNGRKISGAAMTVVHGRIYAGYSLLIDPNYEVMDIALNPNSKKISSHGVKSVRSRVGTLRDALDDKYKDITVWEFSDEILKELLEVDDLDQAKRYELTEEDWAAIDKIAADHYNNWDWNYGHFREFEYQVDERFEGVGTLHIGLEIKHARIDDIQINGDFFSVEPKEKLEEVFKGVRLDKTALHQVLDEVDVSQYINNMDQDTLINFILEIPQDKD